MLSGFGSGVELDAVAVLVSVVLRASTVAVTVIVAVPLAAIVPSEHETVASQLPWLATASTSPNEAVSIGSLTITSCADEGPKF